MSGGEQPNEIITAVRCPGCEMLSMTGDLATCGHPDEETGHHLACPRCDTRVSACDFYDYVDLRVVDHE